METSKAANRPQLILTVRDGSTTTTTRPATTTTRPATTTTTLAPYPGPLRSVGAAPLGSSVGAPPVGAKIVATTGSDSNPGTAALPLRTIAAAVSKTPSGGTIVVRNGVYHESVQVYSKALTIQAWPNEEVWLDGSTRLTTWTQVGSFYRTKWTSPFTVTTPAANGIIDPANPAAGHPELVFRNGVAMRQVFSSAELASGTFFVDRSAGYLWIGNTPIGYRIDVSNLEWALYFNKANDSKLLGIGIRRYATTPSKMAAVRAYGDRVLIDNVVVRDTALSATSVIGNGVTIRDTTVSSAGFIGIHGNNADNLTIERNFVENANTFGFNSGHSAAGMKLTRSRHLHIEGNAFIGSDGPGVWTDQDTYDINVVRNYIYGSADEGIEIELSAKAVIAGNVIVQSAAMGIKILDSNNMAIWNNTLIKNRTHIETFDGTRDATDTSSSDHDSRFPAPQPGITWNTHDIVIRNNVMYDGTPNSFAMLNTDDITHVSNATASNISADYSVYIRAVPSTPQWIGRWAAYPAPIKTATTLAGFRTATGQEAHGVGYDAPATPLLVNVAASDFRVSSTTPMGTNLPPNVATLLHVSGTTVPRGVLE